MQSWDASVMRFVSLGSFKIEKCVARELEGTAGALVVAATDLAAVSLALHLTWGGNRKGGWTYR